MINQTINPLISSNSIRNGDYNIVNDSDISDQLNQDNNNESINEKYFKNGLILKEDITTTNPLIDNINNLNNNIITINSDDFNQFVPQDAIPVCISFEQLNVISKLKRGHQHIHLLKDLNGSINGGLWAIMGGSGAGKSTLLNALSYRIDRHSTRMTGSIKINGAPITNKLIKAISGYVMQDDVCHSHFTVDETLEYAGLLRLSRHLTYNQRYLIRKKAMELMHIDHVKDVIVGNSRNKGISGGERKRMCVAMELMTKPHLLFCDEPTSGLDSVTAFQLCNTLKSLSTKRVFTCICTIHQPQYKLYKLFDNIILMSKGYIIYRGNTDGAQKFFECAGFPIPPATNPADHLLDILIQESEKSPVIGTSIYQANKTKIKGIPILTKDMANVLIKYEINRPTWSNQFFTLLDRCFYEHLKNWHLFFLNVFVTSVIAFAASGSVWYDVGYDKTSYSRRMNALFFCVIHQGVISTLQGTHSFPLERAIMLRERASGSYYISAYYLSKTLADSFCFMWAPVIYSSIAYPRIGFQMTYNKFFTFMLFMILNTFAATSLANMISCIFISIELSTVVLASLNEIVRFFGAWFIYPALMFQYPQWRFGMVISYVYFGFIGVALNENDGLVVDCTSKQLTNQITTSTDGQQIVTQVCKIPPMNSPPYTGDRFNAFYGYDQYTVGECFGCLILYICVTRLIGYLALRYIKI